ncbi:hypothetical protein [Pseudomonas sp. 37 R 15]|nr:hypothetical protein [Pseudomonas sp. 37 R 15]
MVYTRGKKYRPLTGQLWLRVLQYIAEKPTKLARAHVNVGLVIAPFAINC